MTKVKITLTTHHPQALTTILSRKPLQVHLPRRYFASNNYDLMRGPDVTASRPQLTHLMKLWKQSTSSPGPGVLIDS